MGIKFLQDWSFTQAGGGEGTKEGEWLPVSQFPTTVHVELLKLRKIPDPVGLLDPLYIDFACSHLPSSLDSTNGMSNVRRSET
jgi:hypothetical protein